LSVVLERAPHLGVGIDESTALVVGPDGRWTVLGASVVVVYDARRSARAGAITSAAAPVLGATGVVLHVLPAGSTFDPATGSATLPPARSADR
jgi:cyanophycinase